MYILYLIILTSILLIIFILFLRVWKTKESKDLISSEQPWATLIQQFKSVAPQIKSIQELEDYLLIINDEVKDHETDYTFLKDFNAVIHQVRERLMI